MTQYRREPKISTHMAYLWVGGTDPVRSDSGVGPGVLATDTQPRAQASADAPQQTDRC